MNAEVRQMKTSAEIGLAQAFAATKAKLPGAGEIAAMREARAGKLPRFKSAKDLLRELNEGD